jgi:hypothetical protein
MLVAGAMWLRGLQKSGTNGLGYAVHSRCQRLCLWTEFWLLLRVHVIE